MTGIVPPSHWLRSLGAGSLCTFLAAGTASAAEFPRMTETQHELLFSVPSIIYGLALAKLVGELGEILRTPKTVPKSLSQVLWIFVVMLFILMMFFSGVIYTSPLNDFRVFLSTIVLALLLYLAADALVVPGDHKNLSPEVNFRTEFQARSRHFITYTLLGLLWLSARDTLFFLHDLQKAARIAQENSLRIGVSLTLIIPWMFPRAWAHIPISLVSLTALLYHLYVTPGFIRPLVEAAP